MGFLGAAFWDLGEMQHETVSWQGFWDLPLRSSSKDLAPQISAQEPLRTSDTTGEHPCRVLPLVRLTIRDGQSGTWPSAQPGPAQDRPGLGGEAVKKQGEGLKAPPR